MQSKRWHDVSMRIKVNREKRRRKSDDWLFRLCYYHYLLNRQELFFIQYSYIFQSGFNKHIN